MFQIQSEVISRMRFNTDKFAGIIIKRFHTKWYSTATTSSTLMLYIYIARVCVPKHSTLFVILLHLLLAVRTLLDNPRANRAERRSALVARVLATYKIDITALSETHLSSEDQLSEAGGGYTFFWRDRSTDERRKEGAGFAIKTLICWKSQNV